MQTLQQTLVEEQEKIVQNANHQRSMLEESLHSTKTEEQRLRTKLSEAEEVSLLACSLFSLARIKTTTATTNQTFHFARFTRKEKKSIKTINLIRQKNYSE